MRRALLVMVALLVPAASAGAVNMRDLRAPVPPLVNRDTIPTTPVRDNLRGTMADELQRPPAELSCATSDGAGLALTGFALAGLLVFRRRA
jgi:MYXO-CTERM domain-containing protein